MAAVWPLSRARFLDATGAPMVGAKLTFYDAETSTPQPVYSDAGLSLPIDQPIEADANGAFTQIYLSPGTYRQRMTNAADVVQFDDDDISVPLASDYVPPDTGDTDPTLLFATGDYIFSHRTGTRSGCVRANGRTIGSATSGATERANADCEPLFLFLWTQDANLAVSGGRGGTAAGDWAANKTITLPSLRDRVPIGLGDMGNTDANLIADALTSSTNTTLGATAGASTVVLDTTMIPSHTHTFTGSAMGTHSHTFPVSSGDSPDVQAAGGGLATAGTTSTSAVSAGTPAGTNSNTGGGLAHANVQPGMFVTVYIHL